MSHIAIRLNLLHLSPSLFFLDLSLSILVFFILLNRRSFRMWYIYLPVGFQHGSNFAINAYRSRGGVNISVVWPKAPPASKLKRHSSAAKNIMKTTLFQTYSITSERLCPT